jgi:hypothetical protein
VQVWRRTEEGWKAQDFVGCSGVASLALEDRIELGHLYRNSTL